MQTFLKDEMGIKIVQQAISKIDDLCIITMTAVVASCLRSFLKLIKTSA